MSSELHGYGIETWQVEHQTCQVGRRRCGDGWQGCLSRDGNDPPASYAFLLAGVDPGWVRLL